MGYGNLDLDRLCKDDVVVLQECIKEANWNARDLVSEILFLYRTYDKEYMKAYADLDNNNYTDDYGRQQLCEQLAYYQGMCDCIHNILFTLANREGIK